MCLSSITDRNPKTKSGYGYKVVRVVGLDYWAPYRSDTLQKRRWINSSGPDIHLEWSYVSYPSGFHIWDSPYVAYKHMLAKKAECKSREFAVVKVKYAQAETIGTNVCGLAYHKCIVVKKMRILYKVDKKGNRV